MTDPKAPMGPSRLMPVALGLTALLAAAGVGLFAYAIRHQGAPADSGAMQRVVLGDKTCDPADLTLPAGRTVFEIENASDRTTEWEILDGVMVVAERENIAPGFRAQLTVRLKPGAYEITCGLLSNPRGRLVVEPSASSEAERAAPPLTAFIGPLSEYKVYLATQSAELVAATAALDAAVKAGDVGAAKAAWIAARQPWHRIEPVAGRLADLQGVIDPQSDYLAAREADPAFTGFHRLEYGLWAQGSTEGLAPVADRLVADVGTLAGRLRDLKLAPEDLAAAAAQQAGRLAEGQIAGGQDKWAAEDLQGFEASLDGIGKAAGLIGPLAAAAAPDVGKGYDDSLAAARAALAALKAPEGYPPYDRVDEEARKKLADAFGALAQAIGAMNPAIGLE